MGIAERYKTIRSEVEEVAREAGRDPKDVTLVAVSKTVGVDGVAEAISAGATDFGENRPEQLMEKYAAFPQVNWHFIGNIQSRRIKDIVPCAYMIHSLCKLEHAKKINDVAARLGKEQRVLVEVNVSGELSKSGITPEEAPAFLRELESFANLRVSGLMTMAPEGDLSVAKTCFADLAQLEDELREQVFSLDGENALAFNQLSMGMSEDWREAVQEMSTMVRIGRAIFSDDYHSL